MSLRLGVDIGAQMRAHATTAGWVRAIAGLLLAAVLMAYALRALDLQHFARAVSGFGSLDLALGLACLGLAFAVRIERWRRMLGACGAAPPRGIAAATFMGSIALNNILPLRAGDIARAFGFRRQLGISGAQVLGILVVERILDVLTLLGLLAALSLLLPPGTIPDRLALSFAVSTALIVACGLAVVLLAGPLAGRLARAPSGGPLLARVLVLVRGVLEAMVQQSRATRLATTLGLSVLAWLLEGGLYVAAAHGLQIARPVETGFLVLTLATLSTVVPSSPGYFGTFHFVAAAALRLLSVDAGTAAAYAVVTHLLLWLPPTLIGLGCLFALGRGEPAGDTAAERAAP